MSKSWIAVVHEYFCNGIHKLQKSNATLCLKMLGVRVPGSNLDNLEKLVGIRNAVVLGKVLLRKWTVPDTP